MTAQTDRPRPAVVPILGLVLINMAVVTFMPGLFESEVSEEHVVFHRLNLAATLIRMADAAVKALRAEPSHRLTQPILLMEGTIEAVILSSPHNTLPSRSTATTPATRIGPPLFQGMGIRTDCDSL